MRFIRYLGMGVVTLAVAAPGGAYASLDACRDDYVQYLPEYAPADLPAHLRDALPDSVVQATPAVEAAGSRPALAWIEAQQTLAVQETGSGFAEPVALERLEQARGGADTVSNDARLSGVVTGNAAINVVTGSNVIDGASLSNASGIPIVIQNSGANVLIQNATIVNLQLR